MKRVDRKCRIGKSRTGIWRTILHAAGYKMRHQTKRLHNIKTTIRKNVFKFIVLCWLLKFKGQHNSVFLYADDILLWWPRLFPHSSVFLVYMWSRIGISWYACKIQRNPHVFISVPVLMLNVTVYQWSMKFKLSCSDSVRYLGIYLRSLRTFACSFSHAKQSMYHAFNAVFGKVGRIASPDVAVQLVKTKFCQLYVTASRYVLSINLILDLISMLYIIVYEKC